MLDKLLERDSLKIRRGISDRIYWKMSAEIANKNVLSEFIKQTTNKLLRDPWTIFWRHPQNNSYRYFWKNSQKHSLYNFWMHLYTKSPNQEKLLKKIPQKKITLEEFFRGPLQKWKTWIFKWILEIIPERTGDPSSGIHIR